MGSRDLHQKPFDKGTIAKLEIFEDYAQAWIPTFVMMSAAEIHIFDFFSGPGCDCEGTAGSPLRILQKISEQTGNILQKKTKIVLHFNEYEPKNKKEQAKYLLLKENCERKIRENPKFKYFLTANYYNEDAAGLFFKLLPSIRKFPSLVYLDQNGVKFISKEYLSELEKLTTTDFLYFVSSSYFKWLGKTEEFKKALEIDPNEIEKAAYQDTHRLVIKTMKSTLPANTGLKLFPFSIKKTVNKTTNIYGIIFGAKNYAAVDKFLSIAWKRNEQNGEADFDIDEDSKKSQLEMFGDKKKTKIEKFQSDFEMEMLTGNLHNNKEALIHIYSCGHIPQHGVEVIRKLKDERKLSYEGRTPALNYKNVFKERNIVSYSIIKK